MRRALFALAILAIPAVGECGPITYYLRDARFFGGSPGPSRELNASGAYGSTTVETLPTTYSTGGVNPTVFTGTASTQGSPLELRATNTVAAGSSVALNFNLAPNDPTNFVSLVQSRLQENGVFVTGATGDGYLLPHFEIDGTFDDSHATAYAQVSACAGIATCTPTGLGTSTGGAEALSTTFTPGVGSGTKFTFNTPFAFFFFVSSGISSTSVGTLAPGSVSADFRLRLLGFSVVDENGTPIDGAVVHSDLDNVPEPVGTGLLLLGLGAVARRRMRR
ncbi:MAG TPA: hypothetical protein VMF13_15480 [Luteitalea sp.]|nr:hypothetical protein [Luteitalea sp.]